MVRIFQYNLCSILTVLLIMCYNTILTASTGEITIEMPKCKGTIYQLFDIIGKKTGLSFVYDSNTIDNNKKTRIEKGRYTIRQAICIITGNKKLDVRTLGNHILITPLKTTLKNYPSTNLKQEDKQIEIVGVLIDKSTNRPLDGSFIRVEGTSIGSATNRSGEFRLTLPSELLNTSFIVFSHLGYKKRVIEASHLVHGFFTIKLEEQIITLQEVVLRLSNPLLLLEKLRENKKLNYPHNSVCATSFYREGVDYEKRFVKLSEGVFKIYKPSALTKQPDKVELLKMRNIYTRETKDSVITKMKAGIEASLMLDLIKNTPDFLDPNNHDYDFISTGITTFDGRMVDIVYFKQKEFVDDPCYCGELYIDAENYALLGAKFEISPKHIKSTANIFIEKKSKGIKITPLKISYNLSYKPWNGKYYINYVRGDLLFNFKKYKHLFRSSHLHTWFEMATCKIDTTQIKHPIKSKVLPARTIFEETNFPYDESFWENFNVIPIEKDLKKSIEKISLKIEEYLNDAKD